MISSTHSLSPATNVYTPTFTQANALEKQIIPPSLATPSETLRAVDHANKSSLQQGDDLNKQESSKSSTDEDKPNKSSSAVTKELNIKEQARVNELQQRDTEVKAHEQAHLSAAGGIATSGASFTYTKGPDGKRYATGGEVSIDTSAVAGDPAATLAKADAIKRAALAPASPSSQDQKVAASATTMSNKAQTELLKMQQENADPENTQEPSGHFFDQIA